jgi:hypothetical protein
MKQQIVVMGAKCFAGNVKNERSGQEQHYDSTTVFAQMRMEGENLAGSTVVEYKWGTSENFKKIRDLVYPFQAEIDVEQVANAKGVMRSTIVDLKPVAQLQNPVKTPS